MTKFELLSSMLTSRQTRSLQSVQEKLRDDPEFLDRKETPVPTVSVPSCYNEVHNTTSDRTGSR